MKAFAFLSVMGLAATAATAPANLPSSLEARDTICGYCRNREGMQEDLKSEGNNCYDLVAVQLPTSNNRKTEYFCQQRVCGLCVMFKEKQCQGDIMHWGGPGKNVFDATGTQSYFCY